MRSQSPRAPASTGNPSLITVRNGVCVLSGYGLHVAVDRGQLLCRDGLCDERREGRFPRATSGLKRLVILGHTGAITFDAIRWLHDVGVALTMIDGDGQILLASGPPGSNFPHLRRAQAMTAESTVGLDLLCDILGTKLAGQAANLRRLGKNDQGAFVDRCRDELPNVATSSDRLALVEAKAAAAYWSSVASVPLTFARRDAKRAPTHWCTFGTRSSPLAAGARRAATPANALLNYLYAILEAETTIALAAVGLDPGLGLMHHDQPSRDSLSLDIMEAIRPEVDAWLLDWIGSQTFRLADFFERRDGEIRVSSTVTGALSETATHWGRLVAPWAERVATRLDDWWGDAGRPTGRGKERNLPTPLTETNRRAGRQETGATDQVTPMRKLKPPRTCRQCGVLILSRKQTLCSAACRDVYRREVIIPGLQLAGPAALAELRSKGADPSRTIDARTKVGSTQRDRVRARAQWERDHSGEDFDPAEFRRHVLPALQAVPLSVMMRVTGLSVRYCSQIRRGERVPHPVYWDALRRILADGHRD